MNMKISANSCDGAEACLNKFRNKLTLYNPTILYNSDLCESELIIEIKSLQELSLFASALGYEMLLENSDLKRDQMDLVIMDFYMTEPIV